MADKVETTEKEREKNIKEDMEEMKKQYETVIYKLWKLETRMDTRSSEQAESSWVTQSKLDALLTNSISQEKAVPDRTERQSGTRVGFVEPQR